jgi:hypothetical protein
MLEIALKVNLRALPLRRSRKGDYPKYAWAHSLSDPFDNPSFPGRVLAFKDHYDPCSGLLHPELVI